MNVRHDNCLRDSGPGEGSEAPDPPREARPVLRTKEPHSEGLQRSSVGLEKAMAGSRCQEPGRSGTEMRPPGDGTDTGWGQLPGAGAGGKQVRVAQPVALSRAGAVPADPGWQAPPPSSLPRPSGGQEQAGQRTRDECGPIRIVDFDIVLTVKLSGKDIPKNQGHCICPGDTRRNGALQNATQTAARPGPARPAESSESCGPASQRLAASRPRTITRTGELSQTSGPPAHGSYHPPTLPLS